MNDITDNDLFKIQDEPHVITEVIYSPQVKWIIQIPKGGDCFNIHTPSDINIWQRFWMRFIGWGVEKAEPKE